MSSSGRVDMGSRNDLICAWKPLHPETSADSWSGIAGGIHSIELSTHVYESTFDECFAWAMSPEWERTDTPHSCSCVVHYLQRCLFRVPPPVVPFAFGAVLSEARRASESIVKWADPHGSDGEPEGFWFSWHVLDNTSAWTQNSTESEQTSRLTACIPTDDLAIPHLMVERLSDCFLFFALLSCQLRLLTPWPEIQVL